MRQVLRTVLVLAAVAAVAAGGAMVIPAGAEEAPLLANIEVRLADRSGER